ncbi:MAG: response regulator [Candidatus Sumerlaeota bacterium]|nr:response regulator [Candidatus Sumerlaeota bacterium]
MEHPKTIVVIDDEERICQSFERVLSKDGHRVEAFTDERQALARVFAGGVDLVISDLMMPQMTGVDILKAMNARSIKTPLVMITGYATTENAMETMRLGAIDYLPKPFTVDELKSVVARGLKSSDVDRAKLPAAPRGTFEIRGHSWVRRCDNGDAIVGAHPFILACCGRVTGVELPMEEDELIQGGACGKLIVEDSRVPLRLWAPISGDVKAVNGRVAEDPALLAAAPFTDGWLLRLRPLRIETELKNLKPAE